MHRKHLLPALVLACSGLAAACQSTSLAATTPAQDGGGARGQVVSSTLIAHMSAAETAGYLRKGGYGSPAPRYGVDQYRIVYRTVSAAGRPTTASGLVVLPASAARTLHTVAYEHGTLVTRSDAPSVDDSDARVSPTLFAGRGYAAVAPDYLGLGKGPGFHPYMDTATEVTASVDMLRAARLFAAGHGRTLDGHVLVTGFSQGGAAAMALARALQDNADRHIRLSGVAPISGPYDVQHAEIPAAFTDRTLDPKEAAFYFAYWTVSMNRLHHLYDAPAQAFLPPYDTTVDQLFDGRHSEQQVFAGVPDTPQKLLTPQFVHRLQHPTGSLLEAMRDNDTTCSNWTPKVPVHLYAARGDRDVAIANSRHCQAALTTAGADAPLTDVGDVGHFVSPYKAIPLIATWFERILPA
jgi:predicted esterase